MTCILKVEASTLKMSPIYCAISFCEIIQVLIFSEQEIQ